MSLFGLMLLFSAGCSSFGDCLAFNERMDERIVGWRNRVWSTRAWHQRKCMFAGRPCARDFREGFRQGYMDVGTGEDGCTPLLPPRKYWSWKYQSAEGQARVAAWFDGYPHGARAAEEDGVGNWSAIQVNNRIAAQAPTNQPVSDEGIAPEPAPQGGPASPVEAPRSMGQTSLHNPAWQNAWPVASNPAPAPVGPGAYQPQAVARTSWTVPIAENAAPVFPAPQAPAYEGFDPRSAYQMNRPPRPQTP